MPQAAEVGRGERFEFGRNWQRFLTTLDDERIATAQHSLVKMLDLNDHSLHGKSFLDIGAGSGLFSLAARRLGARVHSFDYDPACVSCTQFLKDRYFPNDADWTVEEGSVLNRTYVASLGTFDVTYSWGVLHQTGDMWTALDLANQTVTPGGQLMIAIYNDQGGASRRWLAFKKLYNQVPYPAKLAMVLCVGAWWEVRAALIRLIRFQNPLPLEDWAKKKQDRGMSVWYDLVDWVGGYPFEVAKPEEIFDFYTARDYVLTRLTTERGHGCNQFVFRKNKFSS
ncbi:MAG: class I SAM-dependent methyltransferase [Pirellulaceae bacterium]|nr:class I SAM-dependent methyltransferase [Pirellulaceae bacterium]